MNGKQLEALIKLAAEEQGFDFTRLRDAGWQGEQTQRRFTVKNICDCILFRSPNLFFVEIKHRKGALRFDEITQLNDLKKKMKPEERVYSGVICMLKGRIFWLATDDICFMENCIGKKSFNADDAKEYGHELSMITPKGKRKARPYLDFI